MTFETFQIVEAEREPLEHERQIAIRDNEKVLRRLFQKWRREKEAEEGKSYIDKSISTLISTLTQQFVLGFEKTAALNSITKLENSLML